MTLAWHFEDERNDYTASVLRRLLTDRASAPSVWPAEVGNGLLASVRRGRITEAELAAAVERTLDLPIDVQQPSLSESLGTIFQLARSQNLTVYDAAYLDLAMRDGLPLATLDNDLIVAARRVGLPELT